MNADSESHMGDQSEIEKALLKAGIPSHAVSALLEIDTVMQMWRRRIAKRELGLSALRELGLDFELPQLDVLLSIAPPLGAPTGDEGEEVVIGTVAERLVIDPSRASRLVSEMVERGYIQRTACQSDSRRTVLQLTESGETVVEVVRTHKLLRMGEFLSSWPEGELEQFVPMLKRFSAWTSEIHTSGKGRFETEIGELADKVAANLKKDAAE